MRYTTVIFDLDGTVLDTLEDLKESLNYALRAGGYPERTLEEVRNFVGNGIRLLIERGVPVGTGKDETDAVHASFTEYYKLHCADKTKPYRGIPELLLHLRERGCATAVVSNKADYAVQLLCGRYFAGMFDTAAGERNGVRRKPTPDTVEAVMKRLGSVRERTVYVGDSDVDIETAANAGIACISVCWGFRSRKFLIEHGASKTVLNAGELLELIEQE